MAKSPESRWKNMWFRGWKAAPRMSLCQISLVTMGRISYGSDFHGYIPQVQNWLTGRIRRCVSYFKVHISLQLRSAWSIWSWQAEHKMNQTGMLMKMSLAWVGYSAGPRAHRVWQNGDELAFRDDPVGSSHGCFMHPLRGKGQNFTLNISWVSSHGHRKTKIILGSLSLIPTC
jgi:hypothetical protein